LSRLRSLSLRAKLCPNLRLLRRINRSQFGQLASLLLWNSWYRKSLRQIRPARTPQGDATCPGSIRR
jgi:hypothetical protein